MFELIKKTNSNNNNAVELYFQKGKVKKNILLIGGFHGDEPQGVNILKDYLKELITPKNNIYIIPCLNPDGHILNTRTNANGVDLNRNFPTANWKLTEKNNFYGGNAPASEPETKFMTKVIDEISPDIILSVHAPYKIVNFDGPAQEICKPIAEIMNYKIENDIGYPTPGSFGTYCGLEKNIPTITLELGEDESFNWQKTTLNKVFDYLTQI